MLAVVVVRDGAIPSGGEETIAECGGRALLIGSGAAEAAATLAGLQGVADEVLVVEAGAPQPTTWAAGLAALLVDEPVIVLPASADGRDLAPRLAAAMDRPLLANALSVGERFVELIRRGGWELHEVLRPARLVATLQPGWRGVEHAAGPEPITLRSVELPGVGAADSCADAETVAVLPADAATVDLAEAPRIVAGGAGLDGGPRFDQLADLGVALGASVGATRVITDRGWIGHDRQIGTTGVVVDPQLYLAFGISGAVQHTSGLGTPEHIISVNTDAHCPMMQLADLAITADANATLDALLALLAAPPADGSTPVAEALRG